MNKILLTGGTGFLGSHLLKELVSNGYEVVLLKRSTSDSRRINNVSNYTSYDIDKTSLEYIFQQENIDAVIHTACSYGRKGESPVEIVEANLLFGLDLLSNCSTYNVGFFINTDTLLPKNLNTYSLSKSNFNDWLHQYADKFKIANLKLEHMYGPGDDENKFVSWLISQFENDVPEVKLTKAEQKRDFVYIEDVISAFMLVLKEYNSISGYSEFEVGTGNSTILRSFIEDLKYLFEKENGVCQSNLKFGSIPYREEEVMSVNVDTIELKKIGWSPKFTTHQGLKKMLKERL